MFTEEAAPDPQPDRRGHGAFTAKFASTEGLRIDGEVHGDVDAIGEGTSLAGDQRKSPCPGEGQGRACDHQRQRNGPVECDDLLELQPKARIEGDVRYGTIEMHQGAAIDGELRPIEGRKARARAARALKLAAASQDVRPTRSRTEPMNAIAERVLTPATDEMPAAAGLHRQRRRQGEATDRGGRQPRPEAARVRAGRRLLGLPVRLHLRRGRRTKTTP